MKKWVYNTLIIVFALIFAVSAFLLADYFIRSHKQKDKYDQLAELVQQHRPTQPTAPELTDPSDPTEESVEQTQPTEPTEPKSELVEIVHPETGETVKVLPEYAEIFRLNPDTVGWIFIPGTKVNYPVLQTPDNPDYYLTRDFYKQDAKHGAIYAREVCDVNKPSDNITIYGHHMRDGSMFADIMDYQHKSFYEDHKYICFDTLKERHTYEVVAAFTTTASVGKGFKYHTYVDFENQESLDAFMRQCKGYALYDTGVEVSLGDKLICLSTCEYTLTNGRMVVVAKRIS